MKKLSATWLVRLYFYLLIGFLALFAKAPYDFLALNTFLGYLPVEISFQLSRFNDRRALAFWVGLLAWLLFYPNAPYVSTDLLHLAWLHPDTNTSGLLKSDPEIWLIFAMVFICAFSCLVLGTVSLERVASQLTRLTTPNHPGLKHFWIILFTLTAGVGVYIGRFLRLHTIYLFFTPSWFFRQLWGIWSLSTVEFVLIITGMQLVVYWLLKLFQLFCTTENADR